MQADVAFLYEIKEVHALSGVALCYGNNKTEVGADEGVHGAFPEPCDLS